MASFNSGIRPSLLRPYDLLSNSWYWVGTDVLLGGVGKAGGPGHVQWRRLSKVSFSLLDLDVWPPERQ